MKFDQQKVNGILKDIENGIPFKISCESYGIAYPTFRRWIENGIRDLLDEKNTYYTQFLASLREVQKRVIEKHQKKISANEKSHKGSEWILERSYWQYFSARVADLELEERISKLEGKKTEDEKQS